MNALRALRAHQKSIARSLDARPTHPVQFTKQTRQLSYGEIEVQEAIPGDDIQNNDGTFVAMSGYDDLI